MRNACFAARCAVSAVLCLATATIAAAQETETTFHDLSLLVAPELPASWSAGFPPFEISHYLRIGPLSAYNSDILTIDEHTGTQFDAPAHFVPPPDSGLPNAGPLGAVTGEHVPIWQFVGEACAIDCADILESAPNGESAFVTRDRIAAWERTNRPLGPGDVVLFRSGYTDRFYQPFPAGRRLVADPVQGTAPGWPDPDVVCMEYLVSRGVKTLGTDSPSMGPIPGDLPVQVHLAGLSQGLIWMENGTGLGHLPPTGAFYGILGIKHARSSGTESRAFAITGPLAEGLIESAREHRVADLSVLLDEDLPVASPGAGTGNHRCPYYIKVVNAFGKAGPFLAQTHRMDSHTGTHLVPPAYALPPEGFDNDQYDEQTRGWLAEYEAQYGPRGTSDMTLDKVPLSQTCGTARIIDVGHLVGTTQESDWPGSPEIAVDDIRKYEEEQGDLLPGEVVLFKSGYSDEFYRPLPDGAACFKEPLDGLREGWPAPGPDAIKYLAERGIACVGSDGPTLGGAGAKRALFTYWALGTHGMAGVEYLTNLEAVPDKSYFLFAPVLIRDCHGGPGRAIALY